MKQEIKVGDIAEFIFNEGRASEEISIGDVTKVGKTYAEVARREGRVERIRFRRPGGVTFRAA